MKAIMAGTAAIRMPGLARRRLRRNGLDAYAKAPAAAMARAHPRPDSTA
jgi:hypothetical protein